MIFQHTLPQVLGGHKTQTRRLVKPGECAVRGRHNRILAVTHAGRVKWRVGALYAVQPGRTQPGVARLHLTSIRREQLGRVSSADAHAEGFASRQAFLAAWRRIHRNPALHAPVWVLTFRLVPPEAP